MAVSDTRSLILETASELFYTRGYNLVGINEIIDKAGIAKATLYSHFRTKEQLLLSYLDKMDKDLMDSLTKFVGEKKKGNSKLVAVLEFLYPFYKEKSFNGCWCIRTLAEIPRDNKIVQQKITENKTRLLTFLEHLVAENKTNLRSSQQRSLARNIYLLYEAAITESHLLKDSWPIDSAIELLKDRLKKTS